MKADQVPGHSGEANSTLCFTCWWLSRRFPCSTVNVVPLVCVCVWGGGTGCSPCVEVRGQLARLSPTMWVYRNSAHLLASKHPPHEPSHTPPCCVSKRNNSQCCQFDPNTGMVVSLLFETKVGCVVLTGLELSVPLSPPLESWDYKWVSPRLT